MRLKPTVLATAVSLALAACGSSKTMHTDARSGEPQAADASVAQDPAKVIADTQALAVTGGLVAFLKADGITGDATTKGHEKEIALKSYSWGMTLPVTIGTGTEVGRPVMNQFAFDTSLGSAMQGIFTAMTFPKNIHNARLTIAKTFTTGVVDFLTYDLEGVLITSDAQSLSTGATAIDEQFKMTFSKITVTYTPLSATGVKGTPVRASYDVKLGQAL